MASERCSAGLPVRLYGKCFFGGISGNRACCREWQTPCGLENMPGPEPTWAKTEDTAPLCCSFSTRLPVSLLSVSFSLLFLVSPPPYFCPSLFLFYFFVLFFPLFAVSLPHQYLITVILFMKETNTCVQIAFLSFLFLSLSLPCLSLTCPSDSCERKEITVNQVFKNLN